MIEACWKHHYRNSNLWRIILHTAVSTMVRYSYITQTKNLSREYVNKVNSGSLTVENAAKQVNVIRNEIMQADRLRSSDVGRAVAESLKEKGRTLSGN